RRHRHRDNRHHRGSPDHTELTLLASMTRTGKTLYAGMPAWASRMLLALVLLLTILPALPHRPLYIPGEKRWGEPGPQKSDAMLYKKIVADIVRGQGYYEAA